MSLRIRIHSWRLVRRIDREYRRMSVARTPDVDPVGDLIKPTHIFDTPQRRAAMASLLAKIDHVDLADMVDDEFVRQLTVMLRDHPAVKAALEEMRAA